MQEVKENRYPVFVRYTKGASKTKLVTLTVNASRTAADLLDQLKRVLKCSQLRVEYMGRRLFTTTATGDFADSRQSCRHGDKLSSVVMPYGTLRVEAAEIQILGGSHHQYTHVQDSDENSKSYYTR